MSDTIQHLQAELAEAQRVYEASLSTTPLTQDSPKGKTLASIQLPKLYRDRIALLLKIEIAKEEKNDPSWRLENFASELEVIEKKIKAFQNKQIPSDRYGQ